MLSRRMKTKPDPARDFNLSERASRNQANEELTELAAIIDGRPGWWRFPCQESVRGFMGTDPIFIVGDQPSQSPWGPDHLNRQTFYGLLKEISGSNFHLTDLYKKRGEPEGLRRCLPPELKPLPPDFSDHLTFFEREVAILKPNRIIALGGLAQALLSLHFPKLKPIRRIWHFSYVVRCKKFDEYKENARTAIWDE